MTGKKRGQITVFIIIGLIILLTYLLLAHYKKESIEEVEMIQPELIPVQDYVKTCTKNLARDAIDIVGINGGYIYFPAWIQNNPNSYLKLSPVDELKNPYWWYDGREAIPPLDFISKEISDYVEEGMQDCIDNFSVFHNQYDVIELEKFDVITEIGEDDITVKTIYPIDVRDKFNKTLAKLQKFPVTIPIRLKKVHRLAEKIMERENKDYFIEKKVIDLISLDDDETPTTGIGIDCGKKRWELEKVENKLRELLYINLPFIKIEGSKFREDSRIVPYQLQDINPFSDSNLYSESYYKNHYIWDVSDVPYSNMHVSFSYDPKWPIELYVRPHSGRYLQSNPQKAGKMLALFCLHIWHFTYDVIFPVKATIVDDKTDKNERYSFTFAFKAQINHNYPDRTIFVVDTFDTRDSYLEEEYCADVRNEIIVYVKDKVTNEHIKGVNLSFTCGRFMCNMGSTRSYWDLDPSGTPQLREEFPYCVNGVLRGSKNGYEDNEMFIQTGRRLGILEPKGSSFELVMRPIKEFNFSVVKHKMLGSGTMGVSGAKGLDENDKAIVTVKNVEEKFESYSTYPLELSAPLRLLDKKNLDYELQILIMNNESISVGYEAKWTVTKNDLILGKNVTFHVVEKDFKDEEERYLFFAGLREYSKKVPLPEIK